MIVRYPESVDDFRLLQSRADHNAGQTLELISMQDVLYILQELQVKLGVNNSTVAGSVDYRMRAAELAITALGTSVNAQVKLIEESLASLDARVTAIEAVVAGVDVGWGEPSGTPTKSAFNTGTVTLPELAERVKALIDALTTHGMIGP